MKYEIVNRMRVLTIPRTWANFFHPRHRSPKNHLMADNMVEKNNLEAGSPSTVEARAQRAQRTMRTPSALA